MDLSKKTIYENERRGVTGIEKPKPDRPTPSSKHEDRRSLADKTSSNLCMMEAMIILGLSVTILVAVLSINESVNRQHEALEKPVTHEVVEPAPLHSDQADEQAAIDPHATMPLVGVITDFQYLWSQNQRIVTGDMARATSALRAHSMTSVLTLKDGSSVSVKGLVPDYAHGSTVHQFTGIGGVISDYCIAAPLNQCFEASEVSGVGSGF